MSGAQLAVILACNLCLLGVFFFFFFYFSQINLNRATELVESPIRFINILLIFSILKSLVLSSGAFSIVSISCCFRLLEQCSNFKVFFSSFY